MSDPRPIEALLIDDDPADRLLLRLNLQRCMQDGDRAVVLIEVGSLAEARAAMAKQTFDLVLLDLGLPESRGLATLDGYRDLGAEAPFVVLSGFNAPEVPEAAADAGAAACVVKGSLAAAEFRALITDIASG